MTGCHLITDLSGLILAHTVATVFSIPMSENTNVQLRNSLIAAVLGWPWLEISAEVWKLIKKVWRGLADEGMYEVLEYEAICEIKNRRGTQAHFSKRQRVRYLQNNIISYLDQGWGDGNILLNYQCSPGVEADRYRLGHKTYILISLRDVKRRGDEDEFRIEWDGKMPFCV